MSDEHFLDAAILIGRILSWDAQNQSVQAYFTRSNAPRHTSLHVSKGVRSTLLAIKRGFRAYAVQLDRDIRGLDLTRFDDELRRHLQNYIQNNHRTHNNLAGQLRRLVQFSANRFRNAAYGNGRAEDAAAQVDHAIDTALLELARLCNTTPTAPVRTHACPHGVTTTYPAIHAQVHGVMGGHDDDALVAIEAYHIHKTAAPSLVRLVTTDRAHFLNNKAALDKALAPLTIAHPDAA